MTRDLFESIDLPSGNREVMTEGAVILRRFAVSVDGNLLSSVREIAAQSPFRHMVTPGGYTMSAAMTNCGAAGWITDHSGYRYDLVDPETGNRWPAIPSCFLDLAVAAAAEAGYSGFHPDACLVNRYEPGARLTLHQDRNERDFSHPIVSVSLGLPATFQFGGPKRKDRVRRFSLAHGDVAVWGGASRLYHHGISDLKDGRHDTAGRMRINLTFRRAL